MLIGEVSEKTGISARMLRHYDAIGLVSPTGRPPSGYRQYSETDLRRLFEVEALRSLGLTLTDVADALDDPSFSPAALIDKMVVGVQDRLAQEQELLDRLRQVQASSPDAWLDVVHTVGLMRRLTSGDPSTRQQFALSLTHQGNNDAVPIVEAFLGEPDPNVAGALSWALARIGNSPIPILEKALSSSDTLRRHRAVEALLKINSPAAVTALAGAVRNPDPLVAARATLTRGAQGDFNAIAGLVTLVVDGRDDVEAADVLAGFARQSGHANEIASQIADALTTAADPARRRLTAALGGIPSPNADETLDRLTTDSDAGVAATASFLTRNRPGTI